jgi:hypothetical protein
METAIRRRRFRQRIEVERDVLSIVNNSLHWGRPLMGITDAAVNQWRSDLDLTSTLAEEANAIARTVLEIARRLSLNADDSRDVFEEGQLLPSSSVGELRAHLETIINRVAFKQLL